MTQKTLTDKGFKEIVQKLPKPFARLPEKELRQAKRGTILIYDGFFLQGIKYTLEMIEPNIKRMDEILNKGELLRFSKTLDNEKIPQLHQTISPALAPVSLATWKKFPIND